MRAEARDLARAKINLTLHITGERSDGYHLIDSLVGFAAVSDVVTARPADAWSLEVTGPMAADVPTDEANLVLRAARFLGGAPVALTLDKRLPVASGIGGGSSDAAAALRAIRTLDGRPMPEGVERLGADVPVCLRDRPARMRGVGEHLSDVPAFPPTHLCLVNPGVAVSTPAVFAALSEKSNRPMPEPPAWPDADRFATWIAGQRNDLEIPARSLAPAIGVVLDELGATDGCLLARMSGSGATCFGLYATALEAEDAALAIAAARPGWWVRASPLG